MGPHNGPGYKRRHNTRVKIELGPHKTALDKLASSYGYTVTALIRHCIERQLPDLEKKLADRLTASTKCDNMGQE